MHKSTLTSGAFAEHQQVSYSCALNCIPCRSVDLSAYCMNIWAYVFFLKSTDCVQTLRGMNRNSKMFCRNPALRSIKCWRTFSRWACIKILSVTSRHLTCVSCQCCCWDDGFILAEVWALPHIVFEGALGLVAVQGGGVVFWVKAVVGRYPLQAAERWLAAPWLGQPVAALKALDALEGVLAAELTCEGRKGCLVYTKFKTSLLQFIWRVN